MFKKFLFCALSLFLALGSSSGTLAFAQPKESVAAESLYVPASSVPVKNIIFLIGDGMGLEQMSAHWVANGGKSILETAPVVGLAKTYSASHLVTDSAASGTALACGCKAINGSVGLDATGTAQQSSLQFAMGLEKSTGIVVTKSISDATPAAFYAKCDSRNKHEEIIGHLAGSGINFLVGGGADYFLNRQDKRDIWAEFSAKNYLIERAFPSPATPIAEKNYLGIFAGKDLSRAHKRGAVLPVFTAKALGHLSRNPKGFFLMIEGSKIDIACHDNDVAYLLEEMADFEAAVVEALRFAAKNPGTLVVITADHSTGGLTIVGGDLKKAKMKTHFSTGGHSGVFVPVYAFGAQAEKFGGIYENTEIAHKMKSLLKAGATK